jgi:hypothetical protein
MHGHFRTDKARLVHLIEAFNKLFFAALHEIINLSSSSSDRGRISINFVCIFVLQEDLEKFDGG